MTEKRCVGGCCDNRPGWEWVEDPVTHVREKRRQAPQPGQHGTDGHECVPRMAQDGAYLCAACTGYLSDLIRQLPSYAGDLEAAIVHSGGTLGTMREPTRSTNDWGRTSGGQKVGKASPDFPLQRQRVEALQQVAHDVTWWVDHVRTTRGILGPTPTKNPRAQVSAGCWWLNRHVQWLAARPEAADVVDAFRTMRHDVSRAMDLPRDKARFEVGPCPEDCAGTVVAFIGTENNDSAMGCDLEPAHQWNPAQFYRAGTRIKRKMDGAA